MAEMMRQAGDVVPPEPPARPTWARLLLLLPFIGTLWVPFYNSVEPAYFGVPYFYLYQLAWVALCGVLIGIVYLVEN